MKFLDKDQKYWSLHQHPEVNLEVVEETLLILQKNLRDLLLELDVPVSNWFVHLRLRLEKWIFHFLREILLPLHWVFYSRFLMRPWFPTPQCLQPICQPSKFPPRTQRIQGTIQIIFSFQIDGFLIGLWQKQVILNQWTKRNDRSFKWFPKTSLK